MDSPTERARWGGAMQAGRNGVLFNTGRQNPRKLPPFIATPDSWKKWQRLGTQETRGRDENTEKPPYLRGYFEVKKWSQILDRMRNYFQQ